MQIEEGALDNIPSCIVAKAPARRPHAPHGDQLAVRPHKSEFLQVAGWVVGELHASEAVLIQEPVAVASEMGRLRQLPQGIVCEGACGYALLRYRGLTIGSQGDRFDR